MTNITRKEGFEHDLLTSEQTHGARLEEATAQKLGDEMARRLKQRPKQTFQAVRDDLLEELLPLGTSYEQVQGYKEFLNRHMQRRARVARERKRIPFAPVEVYKDDIR